MKKSMPRVYFGFDAESRPGEHIFLSYSRGDAGRIKGIASELHGMGLPIWYDDGLIPGNRWESGILNHIIQSRMTVFFLSKELFKRDKAYMIDEFQFAKDYNKPALCIWLDDIGKMDCTSLSQDMYLWWKELKRIHSIEVFHLKTDGDKAKEIFEGICRRDSGFRKYAVPAPEPEPVQPIQPQYSVPMYGQPVSQPVPKPVKPPYTQPQPVQPNRQPQPVTVSQPQRVVINKPVTPIYKDSEPKPANHSANPVTVKDTPLIIVAVALVVVIVGGIWAASTLSDSSTSNVKSLSELDSISVGDHFTFGNYPQGKNGEEEPIEWRVLTVDGDKALVISEKLLDYVSYNQKLTAVTWETCTLRSWMNNDFLNAAFSSSEQAKIATVTNQNPDNPEYGTKGGKPTQDKIFALSIDETNQYFTSDGDRKAYTTDCAHKRGWDFYDRSDWWWLRSPCYGSHRAAYASRGGDIDQDGNYVSINYGCVRPAFWLNL